MSDGVEYVGVISPYDLFETSLKREALFFDSIAVPNIEGEFLFKESLTRCPIRSIDYLMENGVIFDPVRRYLGTEAYSKKIGKDLYDRRLKQVEDFEKALAGQLGELPALPPFPSGASFREILAYPWRNALTRSYLRFEQYIGIPARKVGLGLALLRSQRDYDRRRLAADLRVDHSINAYPVYSSDVVLLDDFVDGKNEVIRAVLKAMPEPDPESTPWEQILDFRNDKDSKVLLTYFRHWITNAAKREITFQELVEEMEYYRKKYEEHMRVHSLKVRYGSLVTLLMMPVQIADALISRQLTKAVAALFEFGRLSIELREAELEAPGRDLAYLIKAGEGFDTSGQS